MTGEFLSAAAVRLGPSYLEPAARTAGVVDVAIASGLTFSAGAILFLVATGIAGLAGQLTDDVSSFTTGDTIYEVGVANEAAAGSSSDDQIEMLIRLGQRVIV